MASLYNIVPEKKREIPEKIPKYLSILKKLSKTLNNMQHIFVII